MRYRRVFLDATFIDALSDPHDVGHDAAATAFARLLEEYARGTTQLFSSRADVGADDVRGRVTRVAAIVPVRRGLRRLIARIVSLHPEVGARRAEVLAIMRRHRISELGTADRWYDDIDGVRVVGTSAADAPVTGLRLDRWRGGRHGARPPSPPAPAR